MLAYLASKEQFLRDAPTIEDVVTTAVRKNLHINVSQNEYQSWRNSLGNAMSHVMHDPLIPADAAVAVEYRLNGRRFRIDFLIAGRNESGQDSLVIVELKQWTDIDFSDLSSHVKTFIGGQIRHTRHPSYQAWSYASHLNQYNEYVYTNGIEVAACAYLHNCQSNLAVCDERYDEDLNKAPVFIKGESEALRSLIRSKIKTGTSTDLLYRIDGSPIRPSKQLAEAVGSMLDGDDEFVLIDEQKTALELIINAATKAQVDTKQVLIIKGGPGTGKSVIAINALSRLSALQMNARYVTPNQAPRDVYEAKLKGAIPAFEIRHLFSGSASYVDVAADTYDVLIVDEAHRLKLRSQYSKGGTNQIRELIEAARTTVVFIDEAQKVTWKDIGEIDAIKSFAADLGATITETELNSQFRCGGSDDFLAWLDNTLGVHPEEATYFSPKRFDFRIIDDPVLLHDLIRQRNESNNTSRVVAGYCWNWVSKKDRTLDDIFIPQFGYSAKWNLASYASSAWIIDPNSVDEVGCIHTCQGLELDYVGVIVGPDLVWMSNELQTVPAARAQTDKSLHGFKKELKEKPIIAEIKADEIIRNTYRTLMSRGMKGCYVYFTDPATADYFRSRLPS
ncbi:MAG: DNA/RNA helicase domain-containing protein [Actinomycetota bacterium]